MRHTRKKLAIGLGTALVLIVSALLLIPALVGDRVAARIMTEANRAVSARVDWSSASVSLLRNFPNVTLTLNQLTVVGLRPFDLDTLLAMRRASVTLDLGSVIGYLRSGRSIVIRDLTLEQPVLKLRRLTNGLANWDIARAPVGAAKPESARTVGVTLRDLQISDGSLTLDDRTSRLSASLSGLRQSLRGDFARDKFTLATRTRVDSVSARFAGVPYLSHVSLQLDANIAADLAAHQFTLTNDTLRLNTLVLALGGTVTTGTPDIGLDLAFSAPSTAFSQILSLIPAVYSRDFEKLETAGTMSVSGRVQGKYGARAFPAFSLRARVDNGRFRYPSRALVARDIAFELGVNNPGGHVDSTVVDLKRFHAMIGDRPLDVRLVVRTPISDPDADVRIIGAVDLGDVARTVKLSDTTELTGLVSADVTMHARVSDIDARRYDRVSAAGSVQATRVMLRTASWPHPIAIDTAALHFTPRTAELTAFGGKIGNSDVRASGSLDNLVGFLLRDDDLRGTATVTSDHVDMNEWIKEKSSGIILVPPHIDLSLSASAKRVSYRALTATNVRGDVRVKDRRVTLDALQMETLRGTLVVSGSYETLSADRPTFGMRFKVASVDIPTAFAALTTVQALAPIARWAQGAVSGSVALNGTLGRDMTPVFTTLAGQGAVESERLVLQGAPLLETLAKALSIDQLRAPGLAAVKAAFDVSDGRVRVKPFTVSADDIEMTVGGSHGLDQSLNYDLALALPRSALGAAGEAAIAKLAARAGAAGVALPAGDVVKLRAQVTGTLTSPKITTNFAGMAAAASDAAKDAAQQLLASTAQAAKQKADSTITDATRRARAEADRLVADAERQADSIRATARAYAEKIRGESSARIDSLVARATNPLARLAAQRAADRLRSETSQQMSRAIREADERADAIVVQAKQRANALAPPHSAW